MRRNLREVLEVELLDKKVTGKRFDYLVQTVWEMLGSKTKHLLPLQTVEDSLRHIAGKVITAELLDSTCWRMAGNLDRLTDWKAVPPWHGQPFKEWVPLQIVSAQLLRSPRGRIGASFGFKVLAGLPASLSLDHWWSLDQCRYYARYFGFSKRYGNNRKYPYRAPGDLVSLRLYGLIDPDLSEQGPDFRSVGWPTSLREYNREVIKARYRVDAGYVCPIGLPVDFACYLCPKGYARPENGGSGCRAACHAKDWTRGECHACKRKDAWFEPDMPPHQCVDCYVKGVYRRGKSPPSDKP